jgi:hypothetical protein
LEKDSHPRPAVKRAEKIRAGCTPSETLIYPSREGKGKLAAVAKKVFGEIERTHVLPAEILCCIVYLKGLPNPLRADFG